MSELIRASAETLWQIAQYGSAAAAGGLTEHMAVQAFERGRAILGTLRHDGLDEENTSIEEIETLLTSSLESGRVTRKDLKKLLAASSGDQITINTKVKSIKGKSIVGSKIRDVRL